MDQRFGNGGEPVGDLQPGCRTWLSPLYFELICGMMLSPRAALLATTHLATAGDTKQVRRPSMHGHHRRPCQRRGQSRYGAPKFPGSEQYGIFDKSPTVSHLDSQHQARTAAPQPAGFVSAAGAHARQARNAHEGRAEGTTTGRARLAIGTSGTTTCGGWRRPDQHSLPAAHLRAPWARSCPPPRRPTPQRSPPRRPAVAMGALRRRRGH